MKKIWIIFAFLCLLSWKNQAQTRFVTGAIYQNGYNSLDKKRITLGGFAYLDPNVETGWKRSENTWVGLEVGARLFGFWSRNFSSGIGYSSIFVSGFYRKDLKLTEKLVVFSKINLQIKHGNEQRFNFSATNKRYETSNSVRLQVAIGADYFFQKKWALTTNLSSGGLYYARLTSDLSNLPPVLTEYGLDLTIHSLIYGVGLRYFW
jgi:hypothetical protein